MARVFLIYGSRGAGKTTTTLTLAERLLHKGIGVGGYYQRTTTDDLERRGYDLVSVRDAKRTLPLARPGGQESPGTSAICSFSFYRDSFAAALGWLQHDAAACRALVIDEVSKLEVRGEGHAQALRWALTLGDDKLLLLSVRGDQLFYVVDAFDLGSQVAGYLEIPATDAEVEDWAAQLARLVG